MSDSTHFAPPEDQGPETSGQNQEAMITPPSVPPEELISPGDIDIPDTDMTLSDNGHEVHPPAANVFNPEAQWPNFWPQAAAGSQLAQYENGGIFETSYSPGPPIPEEVLKHVPAGTSIAEEGSILEESGRTYHGYEAGKYFLPNDPVWLSLRVNHAYD
jgi:hypothetical protein